MGILNISTTKKGQVFGDLPQLKHH